MSSKSCAIEDSQSNRLCDSLAAGAKHLLDCIKRLRSRRDLGVTSKTLNDIHATLIALSGLTEEVRNLEKRYSEAADREFMEVESRLQEVCTKRGWRLDGQWPDFIVDYGVSIHVDETKRSLIVEGSPTAMEILEASLEEHTVALLPKKSSAEQFMKNLTEAYDVLAASTKSSISILDLYRELVILVQSQRFWRDASSTAFHPLTMAQFRAQFSRMLDAGVFTTADGRELRLLPPINAKDAVFIYQPAERRFGFVGRVELTRG